MKISQDTVVSLNYSMFDDKNRLIDKNDAPIVYLHGGYDNILPPVEAALESRTAGETVKVTMTADEAFGDIDESLIREEDVSLFPNDIEVGMAFETRDPETGDAQQFRITGIDAGIVTVNGNHPLAGMALRFEATVLEVRAATEEEIEHGHVHGEHSHAHAQVH